MFRKDAGNVSATDTLDFTAFRDQVGLGEFGIGCVSIQYDQTSDDCVAGHPATTRA